MKMILLLLLITTPLGALETHGEFQVGHDTETPNAFTYVRLNLVVETSQSNT